MTSVTTDVNSFDPGSAGSGRRRPLTRTYSEYPAAIWGSGINKSYGSGKNKLHVLNNLNISVPRGCIYGLLGPSGCGKTTLLRSIIGRLHADTGHVIVLGDRPGARGHKIPGSMVGYMPQETALFLDLTISETLRYFGTLHGMTSDHITQRTDFLIDFLTLPQKSRLVGQLSGGQMRRVSFSVALLHEPELLILDEPTVGVDPLLRERIWEHLINITSHSESQTTIILTTHYIEEARQADKVGFMRNGRILLEEDPSVVMRTYNLNNLEDVFLKICQDDIKGTPTDLALSSSQDRADHAAARRLHMATYDDDDVPLINASMTDSGTCVQQQTDPGRVTPVHGVCLMPIGLPSCRNILAQFIKNIRLMKRNIGFLLFQFMLPLIQVVLFCLCIGNDPIGLRVATINNDTGPLGHVFLQQLDNNTISQVMYNGSQFNDAYRSVKQGKAWGIINIGENFTNDLVVRFAGGNVSTRVIDGSSVKLQLDSTNQQVYLILVKKVTEAFEKFGGIQLSKMGLNPLLASLPVEMLDPVYGDMDASFTDFMAPGVIISITFFLATGMTTLVFVMDKKSGMLDRCLASGMVSFEIMLAHMFTQMLVVIVQVTILLVCVLVLFHVPCHGPLIWVVLFVLIQGFCGMALGVLYSTICDDENSAIQLSLGSFYPLLLLSGIIWPIESIPMWLRYISYCSPLTFACEAMRCILARGLDLTFYAVWRGYLVSLGWCGGLVILGGIIMKVKE